MSVAAQTLAPPSRTLMFLEGRAISELGAFLGALPLLQVSPREATVIRYWYCPGLLRQTLRRVRCAAS